jgi:hypothetical protein
MVAVVVRCAVDPPGMHSHGPTNCPPPPHPPTPPPTQLPPTPPPPPALRCAAAATLPSRAPALHVPCALFRSWRRAMPFTAASRVAKKEWDRLCDAVLHLVGNLARAIGDQTWISSAVVAHVCPSVDPGVGGAAGPNFEAAPATVKTASERCLDRLTVLRLESLLKGAPPVAEAGWGRVAAALRELVASALPCPLAFAGGMAMTAAATEGAPGTVTPYSALMLSCLSGVLGAMRASGGPPSPADLQRLRGDVAAAAPVLRMLCGVRQCAHLAMRVLAAVGTVAADLGDDAVPTPDAYSNPAGHTFPAVPSGMLPLGPHGILLAPIHQLFLFFRRAHGKGCRLFAPPTRPPPPHTHTSRACLCWTVQKSPCPVVPPGATPWKSSPCACSVSWTRLSGPMPAPTCCRPPTPRPKSCWVTAERGNCCQGPATTPSVFRVCHA